MGNNSKVTYNNMNNLNTYKEFKHCGKLSVLFAIRTDTVSQYLQPYIPNFEGLKAHPFGIYTKYNFNHLQASLVI